MTAPCFYTWDDDGSPGRALTGTVQNRLKQILVPCLVTGYGSKPSAGWTLEHEHANGFTLSNGDAYVNFVSDVGAHASLPNMDPYSIVVYCAESLTDTSEAIIDGANLCSGTYRKELSEVNNIIRHSFGYSKLPLESELSSLQWTLVADEKTFTLNCSSATSKVDPSKSAFTLYVGEALLDTPISGNFVVLGGDNTKINDAINMYPFGGGYTSPRDLSTGLSNPVSVGTDPYSRLKGKLPNDVTTHLPSRLNFQQPRLMSDGKFVGLLRGVVYDELFLREWGWEASLKALGFTGTDFTDRGKPVKIGDYSYAFARSISGNSFLTDNPDFW